MTEIIKNQNKKIKVYAEVLNNNKRSYIIKILKLFYHNFSYEYDTSVIDWIENQIIFFLDPFGNKFLNKRKIFLEQMNKLLLDCEYKNPSLNKILLFLFSWSIDELKMFYKINNNNENSEKSIYNLGLKNLKGGGFSNQFVLLYIKSLQNKSNFNKTILFFNQLNIFNNENTPYNFLSNKLNLHELYFDKYSPFVDIDKLFLYLLNLPIKILDNIILNLNSLLIKFEANSKLFNHKIISLDKKFSDKYWFYKKNITNNNINHKFYKIFDEKLVLVNINSTINNYISSISLILFDSEKPDFNQKHYFYRYIYLYDNIYNKFSLGNNYKTKNILIKAKNNILKYFDKKILKFLNYKKK